METLEPLQIKKVAVLGAGATGAGIAAHLANLGFEVTVMEASAERAEEAVARAAQAKPPMFYLSEIAETIRCGSWIENLEWLGDMDWVCEAVGEDPALKATTFAALDPVLAAHTVITTCTEVGSVASLTAGRSASFRRRFMGTHFMPSPRYAKLLELTAGRDTDPTLLRRMAQFLEDKAGRRVVATKDTPGFIAHRLGIWSLLHAVQIAEKLRIGVELVDAVTSAIDCPMGLGATRALDALGLDHVRDLATLIAAGCEDDPDVGVLQVPASLAALIDRGCFGDKVGRGFARSEGGEDLVFDLVTHAYRQFQEPGVPALAELRAMPAAVRLSAGLTLRDEVGEFCRLHYLPVLRYADRIKETISHSVCDIDRAMAWGYRKRVGPFALADEVGRERLGFGDGPFYAEGEFRSFGGAMIAVDADSRYRRIDDYPVLEQRNGVVIRDLGDDVQGLCILPDGGPLSPAVVEELHTLLDSGSLKRFVAVFPGDASPFSYDLSFVLERIAASDLASIEKTLRRLQELALKLSRARCVGAVYGHCTGAIFELAMACPIVAIDAEAVVGLTASQAGLIPAAGGLAAMRLRTQDAGPRAMADAAMQVLVAAKSTCAEDARRKGLLRQTDKTIHHPDRLISEAKETALKVEPDTPRSWLTLDGPLAGMMDRRRDELKPRWGFTAHDLLLAEKIKQVFARATSLDDALSHERRGFIELCGKALTQARMRHLVVHGKPIRN